MTNDVIATDHPLTTAQRRTLVALLDTLLPASEDGLMPSAAELDLIGYLSEAQAEFIPVLGEIAGHFDASFADLPPAERHAVVDGFSTTQPELFQALLFNAYACYYQDDRVLEGVGLAADPPFPRGNTVEAGDLSLLDPVVARHRGYRKVERGTG